MVQHKREIINYKTKRCKKLPKEQWIVVENTHEPIISKETFYKVQSIIKSKNASFFKRKHKTNRNDNYFSGILYCGICNSKMTYVDDKNRKYSFYKCKLNSMSKNLCDQEIIKTKELEVIVLKILKQYIKTICNTTELTKKLESYNNKKIIVKHNPQKIENKKEMLYLMYRNGELSLKDYKAKKQELNNQNVITTESEPLIENKIIKSFLKIQTIKKLDKELVKSLIEKIIVYDKNNIEIKFKFQDEFEEILKLIN